MEQLITTVVDDVVVPVTSAIPLLASSGVLFAGFALLWLAFGLALVRRQGGIDAAWLRFRNLPLLVQGLGWLLFLPVVLGLAVWRRRWPTGVRLVVIAGLAGWNLLVLVPA